MVKTMPFYHFTAKNTRIFGETFFFASAEANSAESFYKAG